MSKMMAKRLFMSLFGVFLTGVTVGFFQIADLGADPFTCFTLGWANIFGTTYGAIYPFVTGALLIIDFFFDRSRIGIATLLNLFLIGVVADFFYEAFSGFALFATIYGRVGLLIFTLLILCIGSSLYFTANLGVSGYDAVSQIIAQRTKWPFRFCRIGTDVICVVFGLIFGVAFGDRVGFGTILTAFCMGPVIQLFNDHLSGPLLYGKEFKKAER
ncbi:MAG: hypothetical protein Q4A66_06670 [Eubacteriales bacterium]|nr:hypothetical protein [Eubacteriales bacterium]